MFSWLASTGITAMPAAGPSGNPFRNRRMCDAAHDGMLITLRCNGCRRTLHFWAADLVKVVGEHHQVHLAPWPCSRCQTADFIDVSWTVPGAAMLTGLTVRRPVRKIERWLWRNEKA